jgi:microcystin-dependent protein
MVGTMAPFCGHVSRVPKGWLLCNGTVYKSADYPQLAAKLRTRRYNCNFSLNYVYLPLDLPPLGFGNGERVCFGADPGAALPGNLVAGTGYYVYGPANPGPTGAFDFQLSTAPDAAPFALTGGASGTTFIHIDPWTSGSVPLNFTVPNMRGRTVLGRAMMPKTGAAADRFLSNIWENVLGATFGDASADGEGAQAPIVPHTHAMGHNHTPLNGGGFRTNLAGAANAVSGVTGANNGLDAATAGPNVYSSTTGSGGGHSNVQPTIIMNYIIFAGL